MTFFRLVTRDLGRLLPFGRQGGTALPVLFFLAVAVLTPFAIGPDPALLSATGGGIAWVAALLSAILPLERLLASDVERGVFDQFALYGIAEETALCARLLAHWLSFAPLLLIACLPAAALLGLNKATVVLLLLGLTAGTPGLAAIGLMIACLTVSLRGGAALSGLLMIPVTIPILIFGAGSLSRADAGGIVIAAALSLSFCAIAPFAGGLALRAAREG